MKLSASMKRLESSQDLPGEVRYTTPNPDIALVLRATKRYLVVRQEIVRIQSINEEYMRRQNPLSEGRLWGEANSQNWFIERLFKMMPKYGG